MDYKENVKNLGKDTDRLVEYRYSSAKNGFLYIAFLFFLNYLLVGARMYDIVFKNTLIYAYGAFLVSFAILLYYYIRVNFNKNGNSGINMAMIVLLVIFIAIFLIPLFLFQSK